MAQAKGLDQFRFALIGHEDHMRFLQNTGQDLCLPLIGLRLCAAFLQKRLRQGTRALVLTEKLIKALASVPIIT